MSLLSLFLKLNGKHTGVLNQHCFTHMLVLFQFRGHFLDMYTVHLVYA